MHAAYTPDLLYASTFKKPMQKVTSVTSVAEAPVSNASALPDIAHDGKGIGDSGDTSTRKLYSGCDQRERYYRCGSRGSVRATLKPRTDWGACGSLVHGARTS